MTFVGQGEDWLKQLRYVIDTCSDHPSRLTEWENSFIESVSEQLDRHGTLSERQEEILERIYQKVP